jgi:Domain of unknown function(DUF2779)
VTDSDNQTTQFHRLDKPLFAAGMQCAKRLYQEFHDPDSIPKPNEIRKALFEIGLTLTKMAWEGFPNGERVEEKDHAAAVARTAQLLENESGAAIFDAAFVRNGVEIRCDVVLPSRADKEIDIFEVKAGTKVKPRHVMDVALQMWVVEGAGYTVKNASLLHLDAEYRHNGGKTYPVHKIFKNADVSKKARKRKRRIEDYIDNFQIILDDETTLELPTGTWCINPIPCCYAPQCRKLAPKNPLLEFPDLTPGQESELHQLGIETIDQIAADTESLTPIQKRVLRSFASGGLVLDELVAEELDTIVYPLCAVSTELALQVLPRFENSRPWQHIPFQWSARILHEDGKVEYRSFVANGVDDPRPAFVTSLATCIDDVGTVVTWSRKLEASMRQIMEDVSSLKDEIRSLLQMDPLALDVVVRTATYHPAQKGSFELQAAHAAFTGKALATAKTGIRDAEDARAAFEKLHNTRTRSTTRTKLRKELEDYGANQSQAMLEIVETLQAKLSK